MQPASTVVDTASVIVLVLLGIGLLLHLIFAVATGLVAKSKERSFAGWLILGVFFGLFAFLLSLCLPKSGQPFAAGNIVGIVVLVAAPAILLPCIGIIGAIAVPNFIEAQQRAMVARTHSELRIMATALEMYYLDNSAYPPAKAFPAPLTTPIAYTSGMMKDPFTQPPKDYGYRVQQVNGQDGWILWGVGPDKQDNDGEFEYDPSNGTISSGDIIRAADRF